MGFSISFVNFSDMRQINQKNSKIFIINKSYFQSCTLPLHSYLSTSHVAMATTFYQVVDLFLLAMNWSCRLISLARNCFY